MTLYWMVSCLFELDFRNHGTSQMCFDMVVIAVLEVCETIAAAVPLELCKWLWKMTDVQ